MASALTQQLKTATASKVPALGPNGQLVYQSSGALSATLPQQGLQATSPLTAALGGATPAAAASSATPNALSTQLAAPKAQGQSDLAKYDTQAATSQGQGPKAQTGEEAKEQQRRNRMTQQYGDVGMKAQTLIDQQIKKGTTTSAPVIAYTPKDISQLTNTSTPQGQKLLEEMQRFTANPSDPNAISSLQRAASAAGITATNPTDLIANLFTKTDTGEAVAKLVGDKILYKDVASTIGMDDKDFAEISAYLPKGVTSDNATITQVREAIKALATAEKASGLTGQMERAALGIGTGAEQKAMAADITQAQQETAKVQTEAAEQAALQQAVAGETITVNGKEMTIDEALSDANISQMVTAFLAETDPNGPAHKALIDTLPSLAKFAEKHQEALTSAIEKAEGAATSVGKTQEANAATVNTLSQQTGLSKQELADIFQLDIDNFSTAQLNMDDPGQAFLATVLDAAGKGSPMDPAYIRGQIGWLRTQPGALDAFRGMSKEDIAATGILGRTPEEKDNWNSFMGFAQEAASLRGKSADEISQTLFGVPVGDLRDLWDTALSDKNLGNNKMFNSLAPFLDKDGNGQLDGNYKQSIKKLGKQEVQTLLSDYLKGTKPKGQLQEQAADARKGPASFVASKLSNQLSDGSLSDAELNQLTGNIPEALYQTPDNLKATMAVINDKAKGSEQAKLKALNSLQLSYAGQAIGKSAASLPEGPRSVITSLFAKDKKGNAPSPDARYKTLSSKYLTQQDIDQMVSVVEGLSKDLDPGNFPYITQVINELKGWKSSTPTAPTAPAPGTVAVDTNPTQVYTNPDLIDRNQIVTEVPDKKKRARTIGTSDLDIE